MSCTLTTFADLIDYTFDYLGENATDTARRDGKRAILNAYRELTMSARWVYYISRMRFNTVAPYISSSTITLEYDQTGGTIERKVTLTGGTWPSWAGNGVLVIPSLQSASTTSIPQGNIPFQVASRVSDTVLQLSISSNPGIDFAAGSPFTLYQDAYTLPTDFMAMEELQNTNHFLSLWPESPGVWLKRQRIIHTVAAPRVYCLMGDPHTYGGLTLRFFPAPDLAYAMDAIYQRRPRPLVVERYNTGTVSVTANDTTVTGNGTAFTQAMVGSVIRFSADSQNEPTDVAGNNPGILERVIVSRLNPTTVTVDRVAIDTLTGVKFVVSDPVDLEPQAMLTALYRCIEKQESLTRIMKNQKEAMAAYREALILAREQDSRDFTRKVAGRDYSNFTRLRDYPRGVDIS